MEVSGEDWYLLETRFIGKDERKQSNTFGKLYLLVCVCACGCVHVYVCVCLLPIVYLTFQEKCNKTEVEMNVGALQPRRFQNEKQNCTDKRGVQKKERGCRHILCGHI